MPGKSQVSDFQKPVAYDAEAKRAFHTQARRRLKLLGAALGLMRDGYDLRTTKGGMRRQPRRARTDRRAARAPRRPSMWPRSRMG
jgi:hypothetical protein